MACVTCASLIPADLQKAKDYLAARLASVNKFSDEMMKLSKSVENRARIEKLRTKAADYEKGALQIAAVRAQAIAAGSDTAAAAKALDEVKRIARDTTLPIAAEVEPLANQIADFAKHTVDWLPRKWLRRNGNPWPSASARCCC